MVWCIGLTSGIVCFPLRVPRYGSTSAWLKTRMVTGVGLSRVLCHVYIIMMYPKSGWLIVGVGISPTVCEYIKRVGGTTPAARCDFYIVRGRE